MSTAGIIRRKFAIGAITVREIRGLRLPFCEQESAVFGSLNGQTGSNPTCLVSRLSVTWNGLSQGFSCAFAGRRPLKDKLPVWPFTKH